MARKPDYFEQMVLKELRKNDRGPMDLAIDLTGPEVVSLLRRHHAKVRRIIRDEYGYAIASDGHHMTQRSEDGLWLNRIDLLKKLNALKRGKP